MRVFIAVLVLIFSLQSLIKADDISDFEIEGMSIGDSALDYYSISEINDATKTFYPNSDKFYIFHIVTYSGNYDQISIAVKKNDKKFIIYKIAGDKYFTDNEEKCLKEKDRVTNDFDLLLDTLNKSDYTSKYTSLDDGKSYAEVTDYDFEDKSAIRVFCNFFTQNTIDKRDMFNGLSVSINTFEYYEWLNNEAYD